jgi:hypothetical protein
MQKVGESSVGVMNLGGGGGFFPAAEPEASEGEVLENQETVGDFKRLAGHRAEGDVRRSGSEGIGDVQRARAADGVEAELGQRATTELAGLAAEVGLFGNNDIRAEGEEFRKDFRAPDDIQRAESEVVGELDDGAPDAGVGGVLGDPVTQLERGKIVEKSPRGGGVHSEHRSLVDVDIVGQWDRVFGGKEEFASPSAECKRENFLADAEIFHPCAEG